MKKQSKKRIIAFMLSTLMLLSLFQNISYYPSAEGGEDPAAGVEVDGDVASGSDADLQEGESAVQSVSLPAEQEQVYLSAGNELQEETLKAGESAALDFINIVDKISISPAGSVGSPVSMSQKFKVAMKFTLPTDAVLPLADNYIYSFDLGEVAVQGGTPEQSVQALIAASNTSSPQPIIMGNEQVGTYTIIGGIVTLNFYEGITTLSSPDASRIGEFKFDCGLDEDQLSDAGGTYTLKFSTKPGVENPQIVLKEKDTINAKVDVVKSDAVFNSDNMTATYTITLTNKNSSPVANVVVKDTMGQYLTYDLAQTITVSNGTNVVATPDLYNSKIYNFAIASLPAGETKLTYVCNVDPSVMMSANNASGSQNGLDNTISSTVNGKPIYIDTNKNTIRLQGLLSIRM